MAQVSVSLPADGSTADVADYNTPINALVNDYNSNIDNSNIATAAAIAGSKLANSSVPAGKIDFGGAGVGVWWEEVGRTTLSVAGDTISVTGIAARKYLKILISLVNTGGSLTNTLRFNNDSANNYTLRYSDDGAAHTTSGSQSGIALFVAAQGFPFWATLDVVNILANEKQLFGVVIGQNTAGAANVPGVREHFDKWANTAAQISRVDVINTGTGDYAIGSEVIVLGHN